MKFRTLNAAMNFHYGMTQFSKHCIVDCLDNYFTILTNKEASKVVKEGKAVFI